MSKVPLSFQVHLLHHIYSISGQENIKKYIFAEMVLFQEVAPISHMKKLVLFWIYSTYCPLCQSAQSHGGCEQVLRSKICANFAVKLEIDFQLVLSRFYFFLCPS